MNDVFLNDLTFGNTNYKWALLTVVIIGLGLLKTILSWIIVKVKNHPKLKNIDGLLTLFIKQNIEQSLSWIIISAVALVVIRSIAFTSNVDDYINTTIKLILTFNLVRICYSAADAFSLLFNKWAEESDTELDDQIAPFVGKTLKVIITVIGLLILMQNLGINVTALLAGLGIGGMALAFAAQDTVSNVFGTVTILLDKSFKIGDQIKVGDTEGHVEQLGFRSTKIRTFYNSIITVPNSAMAKERIDNLSERNGTIRFKHFIGFTYGASMERVNQFCEHMRYELLQEDTVDSKRIVVHFNSYGDSSLNVLVQFHYQLRSDDVFQQREGQYLNLIHKVAEKNRLDFAFPTRTLVIENKAQLLT